MYQAFFGLNGKPFQITPDPTFYFASKGHSRALAFLEYGLHQREGFIVITGDVGAGKTTLLRGLLRSLDQRNIVAAQIVSTQVDANDLIRMVVDAFGIPVRSTLKSDLLAALQSYFKALHTQGKRALLVIDEIQNLSQGAIEELRMLSNFQSDSGSLLQSFLVGQPEFRQTMRRPEMIQLNQRVIASYHLGPLDEADTQQYVLHRLRRVGWKDNPHFAEQTFERIHHYTDGVPRKINTLCDRLLLWAYLSERHNIGLDDLDQVAGEFVAELNGPPQLGAIEPPPTKINGAPEVLNNSETAAGSVQKQLLGIQDRVRFLEDSFDGQQRAMKRVLSLLASETNQDSSVQGSSGS